MKVYSKGCGYCLSKRGNIDDATYQLHLKEVDYVCPLCGKSLSYSNKKNKIDQIAHIFPHSPRPNEENILLGVELLGDNSEDFQNKIALCPICHKKYDTNKSREEYERLVKIKKKKYSLLLTKENMTKQCLEDDIVSVLDAISNISDEIFDGIEKYTALKISQKIDAKHTALKRKIENYVSDYYLFIEEQLKNLDAKGLKFNRIKAQIHSVYTQREFDDPEDIFRLIVEWIKSKNNLLDDTACEIVVSFFVQNCEVFDEISK